MNGSGPSKSAGTENICHILFGIPNLSFDSCFPRTLANRLLYLEGDSIVIITMKIIVTNAGVVTFRHVYTDATCLNGDDMFNSLYRHPNNVSTVELKE